MLAAGATKNLWKWPAWLALQWMKVCLVRQVTMCVCSWGEVWPLQHRNTAFLRIRSLVRYSSLSIYIMIYPPLERLPNATIWRYTSSLTTPSFICTFESVRPCAVGSVKPTYAPVLHVAEMRSWIASNKLRLNDSKTYHQCPMASWSSGGRQSHRHRGIFWGSVCSLSKESRHSHRSVSQHGWPHPSRAYVRQLYSTAHNHRRHQALPGPESGKDPGLRLCDI